MELLQSNFKFLRESNGLNQAQLSVSLGFSRGAWNNYETGKSKPNLDDLLKISKYFGCDAGDLITKDLRNVHLNEKSSVSEKRENVHLNVHPNVHPNPKISPVQPVLNINLVEESRAEYGRKGATIPLTDMSVAAGTGIYNNEALENVEYLKLPSSFVRSGSTCLCVKIKGISMSPTLQDGGYVVIRLLDKSEWAKMPDERVFVVIDTEGKSYLKRVKNRFKQGFIVLRSDSPDKATFPSFNLQAEDIVSIWYVEWYFSAKMPNIHDQYYSRLQQLEDRLEELAQASPKINR